MKNVGYFSRGQSIALLAVIAGQAVMPLLFSRWAAFPKENLATHVEKVLRFASTICTIGILGVLLSGKWLILILYGRQFLAATYPMMILVPGTVLYLLSMILIELLNSRGHPEFAVMSLVIGMVINVVLCWILVPVSGIVGAAWALTTGNIVLLFLLMSIVIKKYGIRIANCIWVNKGDIKNIMKSFPKGIPIKWKDEQ
jgi:stage V sporulation protein B